MTNPHGLADDVVKKIQNVLASFPDVEKAILYGSRAKGTFKTGSDIDLTLKTKEVKADRLLFNVIRALDELDLPYTIDLSLYESIDNPNLVDHIDRVGVEFYNLDLHQPF